MVTLQDTAPPVNDEEYCRMAKVSPLLTPATGPSTNEAPLMLIPTQPMPHVTLTLLKPAASVTTLLVISVLIAALETAVKAGALNATVRSVQTAVVFPTNTLAEVDVSGKNEVNILTAIVDDELTT